MEATLPTPAAMVNTMECAPKPLAKPQTTKATPKEGERNAAESKATARWEGGVRVQTNVPVKELWSRMRDFCMPQKIMPSPDDSQVKIIEGGNNAINSKRHIDVALPGDGGNGWINERLITLDDENHLQVYRIEENTFGFVNYIGRVKLETGENGNALVDWSMEMDAIPGHPPVPNDVVNNLKETFVIFTRCAESRCPTNTSTK